MEIVDCYRVLGLRTGASYEDIKASYRRLARIYHPDSNPDNAQQAQEKFIQLTDAYRRLVSVVHPDAEIESPTVNLKQNRASPQVKVTVKPQSPLHNSPELSSADRQLKQHSYSQLQQLLKEQRFPRAIALAEGLAQRLPQDIEIKQWQAITYQRFGRHLIQAKQGDKARIYLKKALRIDPHNKSLWQEVNRDFQQLERLGYF